MADADEILRARVAGVLRQVLVRGLEPAQATEAVLALIDDDAPDRQREDAEALAIMEGKGRGAASFAARKLAKGNGRRFEALRRRFNRLRKKLGHVPTGDGNGG